MKVLFMGSGTFGLKTLEAIQASSHPLAAVVTAPDKPQGRGRVMTASPAKSWALERGIRVMTPVKLNAPETVAELRSVGADLFVVASYGALLSEEVLALPTKGCINVHPSLLPKYRGASPVVQALLDGESRTGMTIMRMAKALDSGDVILQQQVEIGAEENATALTDRLSALGGSMTVQALDLIQAGRAQETPQDHNRATYCSKLKKEDSLLDWNWAAAKVHDRVRALSIWPGTATRWKGKLLKVLGLRLADTSPASAGSTLPGQVIEINPTAGLRVRTGSGDVWLLEVQPEGSRPMGFKDFVNGSGLREGDLLGQ